MATEFLMPKLGLTMEEGTIAEWLVDHGAEVAAGSLVLRIETDKTETDVEASASGRLQLIGTVGETYACGDVIGWFLDDGEAIPDGTTAASAPASAAGTVAPASPAVAPASAPTRRAGRVFASPNARRIAAERGIDLTTVTGTGPEGRIVSEDLDGIAVASASAATSQPTPTPTRASTGATAAATAAARQLADLLGIDVTAVPVDPIDRRVTREAVARHVRDLISSSAERAAEPDRSLAPATQTPTEVIPFAGMRGAIATRMHASLQQMAQLSLFMDADFGAVVEHRARRSAAGGDVPTYTDYVVAAAARALRRHQRVNSQVVDEGVALLPDVHVGLAVAVDDGLLVPVIRDTLRFDLSALAAETSRLARAARSGSLGFADLEGGTFAVTTLGMFGVDGFTPVINPPNAAILGVGRLRDDVVMTDSGVATAARATLSLTWDHRVFDGALAAEFAGAVCEFLQRPDELDRP